MFDQNIGYCECLGASSPVRCGPPPGQFLEDHVQAALSKIPLWLGKERHFKKMSATGVEGNFAISAFMILQICSEGYPACYKPISHGLATFVCSWY